MNDNNINNGSVIPPYVQERLNATYASLKTITQESTNEYSRQNVMRSKSTNSSKSSPKINFKRKSFAAIAVAATLAFGGAAFAATNLLKVGTAQTEFFDSQKNLSVYNSMKECASKLTTHVGQTVDMNGVSVTLDEITCDRNVANLYLTMHKEGGFDLSEGSHYVGSKEGDWARMQNILPIMSYTLSLDDGSSYEGSVIQLDAYMENGEIRALMRITPEIAFPDIANISIDYLSFEEPKAGQHEQETPIAFTCSLDLTEVAKPKELGPINVTITGTDGINRTLDITRFTASELATVVAYNYDESENMINPGMMIFEDNFGNILQAVKGGISGQSPAYGNSILELAGCSIDATSIKMTPIESPSIDEYVEMRESGETSTKTSVVDVSEVGTKIPETKLGGWTISEWNVEGSTVSIKFMPYGWHSPYAMPHIEPVDDITLLAVPYTDEVTGKTYSGKHLGVEHERYDYQTGELIYIVSYYAATEDELKNIRNYKVVQAVEDICWKNDNGALTFEFK